MLRRIKTLLFKLRFAKYLAINQTALQQIWINQVDHKKMRDEALHTVGFKTFSQNEEDGILLYIFSLIGTTNKKCLEICAGTGVESNTANLIVNHAWTGLLFDGDQKNVDIARQFYTLHPNTHIYPPKVLKAWINKENINELISGGGLEGEIDLLSLDIDGIDFYVWQAIECVTPRVVVLEINHLWGHEKSVTVPYDKNFVADFTEHGSDYAGASLAAFIKLGNRKGYQFIGTNRFATNAFFIRKSIQHESLSEVTDTQKCFAHPRAQFGIHERFENISGREWVEVE